MPCPSCHNWPRLAGQGNRDTTHPRIGPQRTTDSCAWGKNIGVVVVSRFESHLRGGSTQLFDTEMSLFEIDAQIVFRQAQSLETSHVTTRFVDQDRTPGGSKGLSTCCRRPPSGSERANQNDPARAPPKTYNCDMPFPFSRQLLTKFLIANSAYM